MFKRTIYPAALGFWIGLAGGTTQGQDDRLSTPPVPVTSQEPGHLALVPSPASAVPSQNQRTADAIAEHLQRSGRLRGYRVDIRCAEGAVELSGCVADAAQRMEVLRLVQALPGVEKITDRLEVAEAATVLPARGLRAQADLPEKAAVPEQAAVPQQQAAVPEPATAHPVEGDVQGPFTPSSRSHKHLTTDIPQEPMSVLEANTPLPHIPGMQPPPMPPNAWPSYAPYNNYSRVGYPTLYPYQAFPFIGPMYPFPKVPLGWRAVTLQWQDGHWWYGRKASGHDWWRIRYY